MYAAREVNFGDWQPIAILLCLDFFLEQQQSLEIVWNSKHLGRYRVAR
jgi:hypothetical protein